MIKNEVFAAFEILLEEIEMVISEIKNVGATAFQKGEYNKVEEIKEKATALEKFKKNKCPAPLGVQDTATNRVLCRLDSTPE